MNYQLSIIIPVYNGEKYLKECLDSIAPQLVDGVELIIINDGSTDQSQEIITNQYAKHIACQQIQYRLTENQGVSAARNLGLSLAQGEYIGFVDCDDSVSADYIKTILRYTEQKPSIIEFGYRMINERSEVTGDNQFLHKKVGFFEVKNVINDVFGASKWYSWVRIINRKTIGLNRYPLAVSFCEDLIFLVSVYKSASTILSTSHTLYNYRTNELGATQNLNLSFSKPLTDYYRTILPENDLHMLMLKSNLSYVIRRINKPSANTFGSVPAFIQKDLYFMILKAPKLLNYIKPRLLFFAIFGDKANGLKRLLGKT